ncbi:methyltransferase domain-containing protein [Streptomonospora algeriensis]|uniref:Methyltransferase domain-containing protein n=1 Tax=Streptomonospora algeriensis TaxID=995084 RepID=A0ABW3BBG9_9ACTN
MTATTIDEQRVQQCVERLFGAYVESMLVLMIDLADRTGLLEALAEAPGTSAEVADRAGLAERYTRECLGALVTGGLVEYDPAAERYTLPPEHALCLTGDGATNVAPVSRVPTLLAHYIADATTVAREGGGIPYERFRPEFTTVMDGLSRATFDQHLVESILSAADGLTADLRRGIRVADIGCGTGHSTVVLAREFPESTFVGYDWSEDALAAGRAEAAEAELANVRFEKLDIAQLPDDPPFHAVVGFDVIHDQVDPAGVLGRVHRALVPGGVFLMMDIKASSRLENNIANPLGPLLYSVSTLHCMTVSLAQDGAGLGTVWGEELARQMLADAGFADVTVHEVPDDPLNQVYVARTATT